MKFGSLEQDDDGPLAWGHDVTQLEGYADRLKAENANLRHYLVVIRVLAYDRSAGRPVEDGYLGLRKLASHALGIELDQAEYTRADPHDAAMAALKAENDRLTALLTPPPTLTAEEVTK
jgi:hypothetical protein